MNQQKDIIRDARVLGTPKMLLLGLQHMFAMFGATILVPILVNSYFQSTSQVLSVQVTLFCAGFGTLFFHLCTKFKVPAFLGSSFAFLGGFSSVAALDTGIFANMADKVAVMYAGKIVETGTCRQVMKTPMHPYTKALLAAKPTTDQTKGEKLVCIEGMPPSLLNPPKGCAFADRCSYCTEKCRNEQPKEKVIEEQHKASCHLLWDEE